ncbi:MAG: hypothetical protein L0K89_05900 [Bifidobacterium crudilactis]|nr:hypothetical protein [Bifidobacterium crudilactis]
MHSAELEGGRVTDAFHRDAQEYVDGSIDLQGLLDRLNQRYAMHSSL